MYGTIAAEVIGLSRERSRDGRVGEAGIKSAERARRPCRLPVQITGETEVGAPTHR